MEMGKARRVFNVLTGLFVILFGLFMFSGQDQAYKAMLFLLDIESKIRAM